MKLHGGTFKLAIGKVLEAARRQRTSKELAQANFTDGAPGAHVPAAFMPTERGAHLGRDLENACLLLDKDGVLGRYLRRRAKLKKKGD